MADVQVMTQSGTQTTIREADVEQLHTGLRGALLRPDNLGYNAARQVWNAMIDRQPALIVRCMGAADVIRAVGFAREHSLPLSIRGGGHNIAGNAVCDGGLMIDLSLMKSVRVDPQARRARVEPGATLGDFDREAQAFSLATPLGINSTTGVAGLTLGGGFGWLSRKHGLAVDNLLAADVVTADGRLVRASTQENPDLFWGLRGGGANLGVVTSFEFQLHPVGPQVFAGLMVFPLEQAKQAFAKYREFADKLPDEMAVWAVLRKAPPLPFLPPETHGKEIAAFAILYAGTDMEAGKKLVEPMRTWGTPYGEHIGPMPFVAWQQILDPLLTPGFRNYWKSHNFTQISDGLADVFIKYAAKLPSPHTEIALAQLGGQASRVPAAATAYAHRDAKFVMNVHTRWETPAEDQQCIAWARDLFNEAAPFATGGVYVNFMPDDESARIRAAYGPNYERMVTLKRKYDPTNLFRMNQNIKPA